MNCSKATRQFGKQAIFGAAARFGIPLLFAFIGSCSAAFAFAAGDHSLRTRVLVYNYVKAPASVVISAEREAGKVISAAGMEVDWVSCGPDSPADPACQVGWTRQTPGVRFVAGINKHRDAEFGNASVPVLATIYYEKVSRFAHQENEDAELGVFLGALIAHELGHIFLQDPEHSPVGIMEACWGTSQFKRALTGRLLFTDEQATRIKQRLESLKGAPPTRQTSYESISDTTAKPNTAGTAVNFELMSGFLVIVTGQIDNRRDLKFILDTGATTSVIDRRVADRLCLHLHPGSEVINFDRSTEAERTTIANLELGPLLATNIELLVVNLREYSAFASNVDGILGADVLSKTKRFAIDYEQRILFLDPSEPPTAPRLAPTCFIAHIRVQGASVSLIVDTGLEGILLYKDQLRRRFPGIQLGPSTPAAIGRLRASQIELTGVQIGDVEKTQKVLLMDGPTPTLLDNVDGYLGPASLHAKWLEFDLERKTLRWLLDDGKGLPKS
jgi:predicted aspartyl protease